MHKISYLEQITNISVDKYFLIYDKDFFVFKIKRENMLFDVENTYLQEQLQQDYNTVDEISLDILSAKSVLQNDKALSQLSTIANGYFNNLLDNLENTLSTLSQELEDFNKNASDQTIIKYYKYRHPSALKQFSLLSQQSYSNDEYLLDLTHTIPHGFGVEPQRIEYNIKRMWDGPLPDSKNTVIHRDPFIFERMLEYGMWDGKNYPHIMITQDTENVYIKFIHFKAYSGNNVTRTQSYIRTTDDASTITMINDTLTGNIQALKFYREFKWTFKIYKYP